MWAPCLTSLCSSSLRPICSCITGLSSLGAPCCLCSHTLQISTRLWCNRSSSSPRICRSSENFFCGPLCYKMEDAVHGFQYEFLESILHFHKNLKGLHLQEPEYVLMAATALFSPDRPGVTQREEIDQLQEEMALILNNHIMEQQSRLQSRFLYAKLMGLLADLRSINNAYSYELQRLEELSAMTPLLGEICS
eukprot:XP_006496695.1 PREDICTED: nuclear receptor subfamily 1 group I member 3 isoform X6 [Mus musculus]